MATKIYVTEEMLGPAATAADVDRYVDLLEDQLGDALDDVEIVKGPGYTPKLPADIQAARDRAWERFCAQPAPTNTRRMLTNKTGNWNIVTADRGSPNNNKGARLFGESLKEAIFHAAIVAAKVGEPFEIVDADGKRPTVTVEVSR